MGLPRSGTTLLHTYLNSHPAVLSYGETNLIELHQKVKQSVFFHPQDYQIRAVGAKALLPIQLMAETESTLHELSNLQEPIRIIFIYRENLLRWFVSLKIAEKTRKWSLTEGKKNLPLSEKMIKIDVNELIRTLNIALHSRNRYKAALHEKLYHEISYEQLMVDSTQSLEEIQMFLGIKPLKLHSLLKKQNPEPLSQLIINYPEVKETLKDTHFKCFIE